MKKHEAVLYRGRHVPVEIVSEINTGFGDGMDFILWDAEGRPADVRILLHSGLQRKRQLVQGSPCVCQRAPILAIAENLSGPVERRLVWGMAHGAALIDLFFASFARPGRCPLAPAV